MWKRNCVLYSWAKFMFFFRISFHVNSDPHNVLQILNAWTGTFWSGYLSYEVAHTYNLSRGRGSLGVSVLISSSTHTMTTHRQFVSRHRLAPVHSCNLCSLMAPGLRFHALTSKLQSYQHTTAQRPNRGHGARRARHRYEDEVNCNGLICMYSNSVSISSKLSSSSALRLKVWSLSFSIVSNKFQ